MDKTNDEGDSTAATEPEDDEDEESTAADGWREFSKRHPGFERTKPRTRGAYTADAEELPASFEVIRTSRRYGLEEMGTRIDVDQLDNRPVKAWIVETWGGGRYRLKYYWSNGKYAGTLNTGNLSGEPKPLVNPSVGEDTAAKPNAASQAAPPFAPPPGTQWMWEQAKGWYLQAATPPPPPKTLVDQAKELLNDPVISALVLPFLKEKMMGGDKTAEAIVGAVKDLRTDMLALANRSPLAGFLEIAKSSGEVAKAVKECSGAVKEVMGVMGGMSGDAKTQALRALSEGISALAKGEKPGQVAARAAGKALEANNGTPPTAPAAPPTPNPLLTQVS